MIEMTWSQIIGPMPMRYGTYSDEQINVVAMVTQASDGRWHGYLLTDCGGRVEQRVIQPRDTLAGAMSYCTPELPPMLPGRKPGWETEHGSTES